MSYLDDDTSSSHASLRKRLAGDIAAGALSATLISPAVAVIDRWAALTNQELSNINLSRVQVEKVSINRPLSCGLRLHGTSALRSPKRFLLGRPFGLIWTLYAATYVVANASETLAAEFHKTATSTITFISTMLVNVPLGIWKDVRYAQIFTARLPSVATKSQHSQLQVKAPKAATAVFLLRDGVTIFGSSTMAPAVSALIPDALATSAHAKAIISQLTVPVFSQLFASPVHLLGLDLYNRQGHGLSLSNRLAQIRRDVLPVTLLRCLRVIPAFGVGYVANMEARSFFHQLS
ncbi:hypothetical protein NM208_g3548 [Fusarium decemcellulare]|uniref:Uncharacterized protein n=1 Tax=Fusarium decemcellulare TaxID=57161 RepID=A0ACC1SNY5_9HYPO|nr:hypothetical protein NM208_g3548 [Fusarium decemcellulare]